MFTDILRKGSSAADALLYQRLNELFLRKGEEAGSTRSGVHGREHHGTNVYVDQDEYLVG